LAAHRPETPAPIIAILILIPLLPIISGQILLFSGSSDESSALFRAISRNIHPSLYYALP
jgi:hypothetical protein